MFIIYIHVFLKNGICWNAVAFEERIGSRAIEISLQNDQYDIRCSEIRQNKIIEAGINVEQVHSGFRKFNTPCVY